jgi:hypothetical protein
MKYMFLLFDADDDWEPTPEVLAPWGAFDEASAKLAKQVSGEALQPSRTATVVSIREGKTLITDGPFIEGKEQLGGYYIFDCESGDIALQLAAMIPTAPTGHVEVRPVVDFGGDGQA